LKIVVLDGYVLNPGDLTWDSLKALGDVEIHDRTSADQVLDRIGDAAYVLTNKSPIDMHTIYRLQSTLKYIGVLATGFNVVDVDAARECGIPVTNVPAYGPLSVAQHTMSLLLELTNQVGRHAAAVRNGDWAASRDWMFTRAPLIELAGLKMGIVGYGAIGSRVGEMAKAFGMDVVAGVSSAAKSDESGPQRLELDELFATCDVVSLHCPLSDTTKGIVDARRLGLMKPSAILLNTARGGLIVEKDLARALEDGTIAAAGLDVLSVEPPTSDNPMMRARNCFVTPHIAWATHAARLRLMNAAIENLASFLKGEPRNVVNGIAV
jgi:glycerate dehydrogenase